MKVQVLILGAFTFPSGIAASARIRNLAKGLKECGCMVNILSVSPPYTSNVDKYTWIEYEKDIYVQYISENIDTNDWKNIKRRSRKFYKSLRKLDNIISNIDNNWTFVYVYGRSYLLFNSIFKFYQSKSIPVIYDIVELPPILKFNFSLLIHPFQFDSYLGETFLPNKAYLLICISRALGERYKNRRKYVMPSIESWSEKGKKLHHSNCDVHVKFHILYIGIFDSKDNPELMHKILLKLKERNIEFIIKMAGRYNNYENGRQWLSKFQNDFGDALVEIGEFDSKKAHSIYASVDAVFLLRKNSYFEECSFPTRLVEVLKSKKMIITSPLGDITIYLEHLKSAFFYSYDNFSQPLEELINIIEKKRYTQIGIEGFNVGSVFLNNRLHAKNILELIQQYVKN